MKCCHVKHKGEIWHLDLGGEGAAVRDPAGNVRAEFTPEEAAGSFKLPSFSESIKQFRLPVDGQEWYFDVDKDGLRQIKAFMDAAVVAAGPGAINALRTAALRDLVLGVLVTLGGIGLTVFGYMKAANDPQGGKYYVTYGLVIAGLVMVGRGIVNLSRYNRLKRVAEER